MAGGSTKAPKADVKRRDPEEGCMTPLHPCIFVGEHHSKNPESSKATSPRAAVATPLAVNGAPLKRAAVAVCAAAATTAATLSEATSAGVMCVLSAVRLATLSSFSCLMLAPEWRRTVENTPSATHHSIESLSAVRGSMEIAPVNFSRMLPPELNDKLHTLVTAPWHAPAMAPAANGATPLLPSPHARERKMRWLCS